MPPNDSRAVPRTGIQRVEMVTIYRDRGDLPGAEASLELATKQAQYNVFSVVAVARDASPAGLGICIAGQLRFASNILRTGDRFILELAFFPDLDDRPLVVGTKRDGRVSLLVKAVCRWFRAGLQGCAAGFQLTETNNPEVLELFRRHLDAVSASSAAALPSP